MKLKTDVKDRIVRTFLDHTRDLFDYCDDDRETGERTCPYLEVYDRIHIYLVFEGEGGKNVRQFLEQDGFEKESIDFFLKQCQALEESDSTASFPTGSAFEKILCYFLKDTLELFSQVLQNDPVDPHYSAIATVQRLENYLLFQSDGLQKTPRELLYAYGRTKEEVDSLYEQFRQEIIRWHGIRPLTPDLSFGELVVFSVEDYFVVVLPENRHQGRDSAGAEFDRERRCIWTQNMSLADEEKVISCIQSQEALQDVMPPFYQIVFGTELSINCYVLHTAHLLCVVFEKGKYKGKKIFDLLQ